MPIRCDYRWTRNATRVFIIIILQRRVIRLGEHKRIRRLEETRLEIVNVIFHRAKGEVVVKRDFKRCLTEGGRVYIELVYLKFNISRWFERWISGFIYSKFETLKTCCISLAGILFSQFFSSSINSRC